MLKRRTGGKRRGRRAGGRRAWAVIRAARVVGGTGDSGSYDVSVCEVVLGIGESIPPQVLAEARREVLARSSGWGVVIVGTVGWWVWVGEDRGGLGGGLGWRELFGC